MEADSSLTGTKAQLPMMAAKICPRRMLMYLGQKAMRSLAALIELALMLIPKVTMISPIAANAAEARAACEPDSSHSSMILIGFHMT